jgi:hypothetical protein
LNARREPPGNSYGDASESANETDFYHSHMVPFVADKDTLGLKSQDR